MSPRRLVPLVATLLLVCTAPRSAAAQSWEPIATGMDYAVLRHADSEVHALRIDLCAPGVAFRATAPGEGPRTTQSFGELVGATAAINGDWPARDGFIPDLPATFPRGLSMGGGFHYERTVNPNFFGFMAFGLNQALHSADEEEVGGPQPWMREVVSGQPTLLWDGAQRDNPAGHCANRRARTSTGLSADRRTFYAAVVEEIGDSNAGVTCNQMGALMQSLGAHSALNQDGGGSSTMWLAGRGIVNQPSDGTPRTLVNHWAFHATGSGPPRHCVARSRPAPAGRVLRHIPDPASFEAWGFQLAELELLDDATLAAYPAGATWPGAIGRLVRADGRPEVYLIDGAHRRHVPSPYALAAWRLPADRIEVLPPAEVDAFPDGPPLDESPYLVLGAGYASYVVDTPPPAPPPPPPPPTDGGPVDSDAGVSADGSTGTDGPARPRPDRPTPDAGPTADGPPAADGPAGPGVSPGAPGPGGAISGGCAVAGSGPGPAQPWLPLAALVGLAGMARPRRRRP